MQSELMSAAAKLPWTTPDPKEDLEVMFENAPIGLAQCQAEGIVTALNPALQQMLGTRCKIGRKLQFSDLVDDRVEGERFFHEVFAGERNSFQLDASLSGPDGSKLRWTAWRVTGMSGQSDYILAMAHEAASNAEADQRLRQAQKLEAVGRLAGGVAHDFNNLLTGVLLYCDLLLASIEPNHRVRKYAEEIRKAGLQATGLVRQLLAVSRPVKQEPCLLSLNEIVEGMRNLLTRLIGENVELNFQLEPSLGLVKMDPTQAQQILLNLVLNARDAMPEGGRIGVETSQCRVQVLNEADGPKGDGASVPCVGFVVSDNGCGMDEATRAHLFEAFFTTKADGKGTGLGLATVYDAVTSNGGLIHVDSALRCGTRVTILLPLVPAAVSSQGKQNPPDQKEGVFQHFEEMRP